MFIRSISSVFEQRIHEKRGKIQVLIGPCQVGKSTMVSQVLDKTSIPYTLAKADDVQKNDREWIHKTWDSARAQLKISFKYLWSNCFNIHGYFSHSDKIIV